MKSHGTRSSGTTAETERAEQAELRRQYEEIRDEERRARAELDRAESAEVFRTRRLSPDQAGFLLRQRMGSMRAAGQCPEVFFSSARSARGQDLTVEEMLAATDEVEILEGAPEYRIRDMLAEAGEGGE